jgi:hypothetical protein
MPIPVMPHDFAEIRWRGHWIWVPEEPIAPSGFMGSGIDPHAPESHGLFRTIVHPETLASSCLCGNASLQPYLKSIL